MTDGEGGEKGKKKGKQTRALLTIIPIWISVVILPFTINTYYYRDNTRSIHAKKKKKKKKKEGVLQGQQQHRHHLHPQQERRHSYGKNQDRPIMTSSSRLTSVFPPGTSAVYHHAPSQQSSALATRVASKKAELEDLKQLRDLSGVLAVRMQTLEDRIRTLKDGTEGSSLLPKN